MDFQFKKDHTESAKQDSASNTADTTPSATLSKQEKRKMMIRAVLPIIIAAVVGVVGARTFVNVNHAFVVEGISMEPTLKNREIVFSDVVTSDTTLPRGAIVVVNVDGLDGDGKPLTGNYIKRLIGLPGDTLQIYNGKLIINGEISKDYQFDDIVDPGCLKEPMTLGENQYFVIGDNRNFSADGRVFGPVPLERITNVITKELF